MIKRMTLGGGALLALALLFAGATMMADSLFGNARIDLTQNRLYSIAPGTEHILKSLKEPINLYFFYSADPGNQLPPIRNYADHVRDLLSELVRRSNGKLRLHVIDPQPFSEDEDRAAELGVRAVQLGGAHGTLYFGLAGTNSTDGHAVIDFFDPGQNGSNEPFLEYDVMKVIYQLSNPAKPVVGWLSGLPMSGGFDPNSGQPREPWAVFDEAQQLFNIHVLDPNAARIDPDINVLVLVHPKKLSPAMLYAIDQFALRGGRILAFVDPLAELDSSGADPNNPMAAMTADRSSQLEPLLSTWGVEFNPHQVIADGEHALMVGMGEGQAPVRHLGFLGLDQASINHKDVVTATLTTVNVATAGYLQPKKGASVHFEPLMTSSRLAEPLPTERFALLNDPASLQDGFKPTGQVYTLAARVSGDVKSAFPAGPPAGVQLAPGEKPLSASVKPLNLIVVADTDLLADSMWVREQRLFGQRIVQPQANNGDFVFNAVDNLAGSDDLISVRGRASFSRPFTRVDALRLHADERLRSTEQELESQLRQTEEKLSQLQSRRNDQSAAILTPEQQQELERFQNERMRIRKQLRQVRLGLDQDITRLGSRIKLVNIVLVPMAFVLVALLVFWRRRRQPPYTGLTHRFDGGAGSATPGAPGAAAAQGHPAPTQQHEADA
jgi:ABC-type uncharacterized transport system involved in gliding motility auxiliary subunit